MKNLLKIAAAFVLLAGLYSCDTQPLQDAIDEFAVVIGLDPINTTASILLEDAATGAIVTAEVNVSYDEGQVVDLFSDAITSETVDNGAITFGISNNLTPSIDNPVPVTLTLTADGYLPRTRTVELTQEGDNFFRIRMIQESNPPIGVIIGSTNVGSTDESGATTSDLDFSTSGDSVDNENEEGLGSSITIPSGTILTDENGAPLTGQLTASSQFYDTYKPEAMDGLPVEAQKLATEENALILGLTDVLITDRSGRKAVRVGGGATKMSNDGVKVSNTPCYSIKLLIPTTVYNTYSSAISTYATFNGLLLEADALPLTGVRTVGANTEISYEICNTMYTRFALIAGLEAVSSRGTINLDRNGNTGDISFQAYAPGASVSGTIVNGQNSGSWPGFMNNVNYEIRFSGPTVTNYIISGHNFTESSTLNVTLPAVQTTRINATVKTILKCPTEGEFVRVDGLPGARVLYSKVSDSPRSWVSSLSPDGSNQGPQFEFDERTNALVSGSVLAQSVEQGQAYEFWLFWGNQFNKKRTITITGTQVEDIFELDENDASICE